MTTEKRTEIEALGIAIAGEKNDLNTPENKVRRNLIFNKMKKLIYGGLFLALVGMVFVGCKKDVVTQTSKTETKPLIKQNQNYAKSGVSSLDSMAQAANIKAIHFKRSDSTYAIETYNSSVMYYVTVNYADVDNVIMMTVNPTDGVDFYFKVNVTDSSVLISNLNEYSFDDYSQSGISQSEPLEKNLVAVITAYYLKTPGVSTSYSNNGNDDVYAPAIGLGGGKKKKFYGYVYTYGPCNYHMREKYGTFYFFWMHFSNHDTAEIEPC